MRPSIWTRVVNLVHRLFFLIGLLGEFQEVQDNRAIRHAIAKLFTGSSKNETVLTQSYSEVLALSRMGTSEI